MATLIMTGGGTAGHCVPNLALIPYLKKDFNNIYYIGSYEGIERKIITDHKIPYYAISTTKLARKFTFNNFTIPFKLAKGINQSLKILDKLKPDVIFSKGGYVALPVVIAGHKRNIPVICHESDYSVGLANKISSKYAKRVLTSFPSTARFLKNGEYVGSPILKDKPTASKKDILKSYSFSGKKPVLLVTGGSQGAAIINSAIRNSLNSLLPQFDVLHLCGKNNLSDKKLPSGYYETEYIDNMSNVYAITDICVSRAGSNTAFELMNRKIPTVFIPLPKGISRGDQILNAQYFQKKGLATILYQEQLTCESLTFIVNSLYANRFNIARAFDKAEIRDASREISRIIVDYIH